MLRAADKGKVQAYERCSVAGDHNDLETYINESIIDAQLQPIYDSVKAKLSQKLGMNESGGCDIPLSVTVVRPRYDEKSSTKKQPAVHLINKKKQSTHQRTNQLDREFAMIEFRAKYKASKYAARFGLKAIDEVTFERYLRGELKKNGGRKTGPLVDLLAGLDDILVDDIVNKYQDKCKKEKNKDTKTGESSAQESTSMKSNAGKNKGFQTSLCRKNVVDKFIAQLAKGVTAPVHITPLGPMLDSQSKLCSMSASLGAAQDFAPVSDDFDVGMLEGFADIEDPSLTLSIAGSDSIGGVEQWSDFFDLGMLEGFGDIEDSLSTHGTAGRDSITTQYTDQEKTSSSLTEKNTIEDRVGEQHKEGCSKWEKAAALACTNKTPTAAAPAINANGSSDSRLVSNTDSNARVETSTPPTSDRKKSRAATPVNDGSRLIHKPIAQRSPSRPLKLTGQGIGCTTREFQASAIWSVKGGSGITPVEPGVLGKRVRDNKTDVDFACTVRKVRCEPPQLS